jgi:hypothetical protein
VAAFTDPMAALEALTECSAHRGADHWRAVPARKNARLRCRQPNADRRWRQRVGRDTTRRLPTPCKDISWRPWANRVE